MAGFLDAKERVIDLVLTDTGKQLLLKGQLQFAYWIPFDDEINYQPTVNILNSGSMGADELARAVAETSRSLTEDPIVREAAAGYRGLNTQEEDQTNLIHPMYTADPGVGITRPLPQLQVSETGSLSVTIVQTPLRKRRVKTDKNGSVLQTQEIDLGFKRDGAAGSTVDVQYLSQSFTSDALQGVLVTVYQNVSGTYNEILHNRSADGELAYRNDLMLRISR